MGRGAVLPWRVLGAILLALGLMPGAAWSQEFLGGYGDLPVPPGLSERTDQALVFDSPGGRVVETVLSGNVAEAAALGFFRQTLPQLGWTAEGQNRYRREGERLEIEIVERGPPLVLRLSITPG